MSTSKSCAVSSSAETGAVGREIVLPLIPPHRPGLWDGHGALNKMQHHEILLIHSDPNPAARTLSPLPGPALWCPLGAGGDQSPVPPFPRREEGLELCAQRMLCPAPNAGCLTLLHAGREGKEPSSNYCAIFVHERREASKRHAAAGNLMALGELRDRALQLRLFFSFLHTILALSFACLGGWTACSACRGRRRGNGVVHPWEEAGGAQGQPGSIRGQPVPPRGL